MSFVVIALFSLLFANAMVAFGVAFYWQVRVIVTLSRAAKQVDLFSPWKDLVDPNGGYHTFVRFIAGEIFPELRRKWLKAIGYVAVSFLTLFLVGGLMRIFLPEYI